MRGGKVGYLGGMLGVGVGKGPKATVVVHAKGREVSRIERRVRRVLCMSTSDEQEVGG
jgi:hypothetical protein